MNKRIATRLILAAGLAAAAPAQATMGLRTKFAEVSVDQLKIGKTYSLQDLVNLPLRVANTGTDAVELRVDAVAPMPDEMKAGYEPIPDTSWIRLQRNAFTVPPQADAVTDVIISVPNDPALLGRKFLVYLWTRSQNIASAGVGLKSRLLLGISSRRPTEDELKEKFAGSRVANLNFNLTPMEVVVYDVAVGKRRELKGREAIKLLNPNPGTCAFRLTPVSARETAITPPDGYEAAPDPRWLEVSEPTFKAKPGGVHPLKISVNIPDRKALRGRRFLFLLRAEMLEQDIPAHAYVKIFVSTTK